MPPGPKAHRRRGGGPDLQLRILLTRLWLPTVSFLLAGILGLPTRSVAAVLPAKLQELRRQAEFYERQGAWDRAYEAYEAILRADRSLTQIRARSQHCLRRYWQANRYRDPSFRREVLALDYGQLMRLYDV